MRDDMLFERYEKGNQELRIYFDDLAENPRIMNDEFGTIVAWHSRYNLGDINPREDSRDYLAEWVTEILQDKKEEIYNLLGIEGYIIEEVEEEVEDMTIEDMFEVFEEYYIVLPVYMYEHSGTTLSTKPFSCPWDSGQVGFIYVSREKAKEELKDSVKESDIENKAKEILEAEIREYNYYLNGEVFYFEIVEKEKCPKCGQIEEREIESRGGFIGDIEEILRETGFERENVVV